MLEKIKTLYLIVCEFIWPIQPIVRDFVVYFSKPGGIEMNCGKYLLTFSVSSGAPAHSILCDLLVMTMHVKSKEVSLMSPFFEDISINWRERTLLIDSVLQWLDFEDDIPEENVRGFV